MSAYALVYINSIKILLLMIKFTLLASKYITAHFGAYGTLADFID